MESVFRTVIRELADIADSYVERYLHTEHGGVDKIFWEIEQVRELECRLYGQIGRAPVDRELLAAFMAGVEAIATFWYRFALFARIAAWNPLDQLEYPDGFSTGGTEWTWWSPAHNPWGFERLPIRPVEYLVAACLMEEVADRLRARAEAHLAECEQRAACARWARRTEARLFVGEHGRLLDRLREFGWLMGHCFRLW